MEQSEYGCFQINVTVISTCASQRTRSMLLWDGQGQGPNAVQGHQEVASLTLAKVQAQSYCEDNKKAVLAMDHAIFNSFASI